MPTVGMPFETCAACGVPVPRPPRNEWSLMSSGDKSRLVGTAFARALSIGLLPALAYGLSLFVGSTAPNATRTVLVLGGVGSALACGVVIARLAKDVGRSRRRMSDPMYLARLAEYGMADREPQSVS